MPPSLGTTTSARSCCSSRRASEEEIPSGDDLAAEIERYLRNEGPGTIPPS